ncbi:MAG: alpha/beta hydrolase [Parasphingorhabdus sp.]|nr:alpha/beta hydrolase [Parasphingorhabdus sp.]
MVACSLKMPTATPTGLSLWNSSGRLPQMKLQASLQNPGRLDEIRLPTLIIWGRHDRLIDVSCATVLHEGIANSELLILEDAGHVPMIEKARWRLVAVKACHFPC